MVKLSKEKEYWLHVSCMALQDSIKAKRIEINRNNGLYEALKNAEVVPFDNKIEISLQDLISQSTIHEHDLRVIARRIKCKLEEPKPIKPVKTSYR